mmetsp:Transcript_74763/g.214154  ORF Transcript_74763/g.214154 Transcript_74763/m.214154 type:complete len:284 (-) Transcript_74763:195-1046(-)
MDERLHRLRIWPEAAEQSHNVLLLLVSVGIPSLDEAKHFGFRRYWHAVIVQRVFYKIDRERAPSRIASDGAKLLATRQHVPGDRFDKHLAGKLLRDRHLEVLQMKECVGEASLADNSVAFVAKPMQQSLIQPVHRVLFRVEAHMQHVMRQHLPLPVGLGPLVEKGHEPLVNESQQLSHPLAIALDFVPLGQEERVGALHRGRRSTDEVCSCVARLVGVIGNAFQQLLDRINESRSLHGLRELDSLEVRHQVKVPFFLEVFLRCGVVVGVDLARQDLAKLTDLA